MRDVRDLVGHDLEQEELERLERVHALLEQASPPPSLSPRLERPPAPRGEVITFPRRYGYAAAAAAAAAAALLFGIGYVVGGNTPDAVKTVAMSGASGATGTISIYEQDAAGNWPMRLRVDGLAEGTYALWLTRAGALTEQCGTFAVATGQTSVPLNVPYRLRDFDGWVVVPADGRKPVLTTT